MKKVALLASLVICGLVGGMSCDQAAANTSPLSAEQVVGAETVDTAQAKDLFVRGTKFLDVRSFVAFDSGRIPGAIHIDLQDDFSEGSLEKAIGKKEAFVVYCNGVSCLRAEKAARMAVKWGWAQVYYYRDGLPVWQAANFPIE